MAVKGTLELAGGVRLQPHRTALPNVDRSLAVGTRPVIAFGPALAGWGSWDWVGADIATELSRYFCTVCFQGRPDHACDLLFVVKHAAVLELAREVARRTAVVYCPVDHYGSAAEIDGDAGMLRRCSRIVIHCERLRRYFERYAPVEYVDHHVKFATPLRQEWRSQGYLLWVGVRSNLSALAEWVNARPLPAELRVLTNLENPGRIPAPTQLGFRAGRNIRIDHWSSERHLELTASARAAIDIKGSDFRSRHKPPAKAIDFIASGVPLAMNPDSSAVEHLVRMGFEVASPLDTERWLSREYWEETQRFGRALRELLSLERVGQRYKRIIEDVLAERGT